MKKRILGIGVVLVGTLLIAVSLLVPLISVESATSQEPIAIIGGADVPTYMYVYSSFGGGVWIALTALGLLALISGLITLIVDITRKKE